MDYKSIILLVCCGFSVLLMSCEKSKPASPEARKAFESIIPKPVSAEASGESFVIDAGTRVLVSAAVLEPAGTFLAERLRPSTGFPLEVSLMEEGDQPDNTILLTLSGKEQVRGEEGYALAVTGRAVTLSANTPAGIIRGVQTIRQLLPPTVERPGAQDVSWEMAAGTIVDYPQYSWRGAMLDVARHFFTVDEVKRFIDLISYYKMNVLHLHLSDDQGWRIEIKSWPDLTAIGGKYEVSGTPGGFYTQEEYQEIIAYASRQHILVVPEIDMPGHINSALVAYQELNVGTPFKLEPGSTQGPVAGQPHFGTEVGFSTLDIRKEITFKFVEDVLRELSAITPGPYLHIGGDEAAVTKKEDYIRFVNRFKEIVERNGKIMIGWEEIAQANVDASVLVQHWSSEEHARQAAEKGARLIMSPSKKIYLDMQYDSTSRLGLHWAAYIEVDSAYEWDPATRVAGVPAEQIVGVEAPLWSETLETMDDIEYLLFPRLPGVAEVGWTAAAQRNWKEYQVRLAEHGARFEAMDIDFYRSPRVNWKE